MSLRATDACKVLVLYKFIIIERKPLSDAFLLGFCIYGIFDLTNIAQMENVIDEFKPELIINPAAYTSVDKAESELDLVFKTNVVATKFLAEKSEKLGIPLIQLSTDYVFDGLKRDAYTEIDKANPQSVYGKSKYDAETAIRESNPKHIIGEII